MERPEFSLSCNRPESIGRINTSFLKSHPRGTGPSPRIIVRCGGPAGKNRYGIAVFPPMPAFRPTAALGNCSLRCPTSCVHAVVAPAPSAATRVVFSLRCVKQECMRWCPALVPRGGFRGGGLFVQVGEYLLDDRRVFDEGNDLHRPAAMATRFDVDVEHTLEPLRTNRARHSLYSTGRLATIYPTRRGVTPPAPGERFSRAGD